MKNEPLQQTPARDEADTKIHSRSVLSRLRSILPLAIVILGGVLIWWLLASAPEQSTRPTLPPAPVVEVIPVEMNANPVEIVGFGNIIPAREVQLAPEVSGRVIEVGESVQLGGFIPEETILFRIDPRDYELALQQATASLERAQADLALEEGRGQIARLEWERFNSSGSTHQASQAPSALALREPQLQQARSAVIAAQTSLDQATLNLERTTIRAPFDATILSENLEVGQRVGPGSNVIHIAGTDTFWVEITVPASQIERLRNLEAVEVDVFLSSGSNGASERKGRFVRILPGLNPEGRMARALIAVDDPLGLRTGQSLLPLNGYARVELNAGLLESVIAPREALRENNQVWVRSSEGTLQFRNIEVLWRGDRNVLLKGDFEYGDQLITSYLNNPLPGLTVGIPEVQ